MFKQITALLMLAIVAIVSARPGHFAASPLVAVSAPYVAAHSSQVVARQYNGLAVAAAPLVSAAAYPHTQIIGSNAATYSSYTAYPQAHPVAAAAAFHPYAAAYHPLAAVAPAAVATPLKYVAL